MVEMTAHQKEHLMAAHEHLLVAISFPNGFRPTSSTFHEINELIAVIEEIFGF